MKILRITGRIFCAISAVSLLILSSVAYCGYQIPQIEVGTFFLLFAMAMAIDAFCYWKKPKQVKEKIQLTFTMKDGSKQILEPTEDSDIKANLNEMTGIRVQTWLYEVDADER